MICETWGPPSALRVEEVPDPKPGTGEILVRVGASGVNFPDTLIIEGRYQVRPPMPFTPGFDVAGTVVATGSGVTRFVPGDRIMGLVSAGYGAFAELAITDEARAEPIPDGMDDVTATAFYTAYGTSYHALVQRGRLAAGEELVVLGAAGATGLAAVEIGAALGARVIAAAGGPKKTATARDHGADEVIDYRAQDLRARVKELTGGRGADVCVDGVGGDAFTALSRTMNRGGRLLVVGFASGTIPSFPVNLALLKAYSVVGVYWDDFVAADPDAKHENSRELARLFTVGRLRPPIGATYPLDDVARALDDVRDRSRVGRLVLTP